MPVPATSPKQWMLGLPGHNEVMRLEEVLLLVKGGQLRPTDLVKKLGDPWRAANEVPELMVYFNDPRKMAAIADGSGLTREPEEKAAPAAVVEDKPPLRETARPSSVQPGSRSPSPATSRVPKDSAAPPRPTAVRPSLPERTERRSASLQKGDTRHPPAADAGAAKAEAPKSETKVPEPVKSETKSPPASETPSEKTETKGDPLNEGAKLPPVEDKPKGLRGRGLLKAVPPPPPPAPRLEPMVGKYFGPADLLRSASFAFDPMKLLIVLPGAAVLGIAYTLFQHLAGFRENPREWAFAILAYSVTIFGLAFLSTGLAYLTRRQVEGKPYPAREVLGYALSNVPTFVLYPIITLAPSLVALGALWGFRFIRNGGTGGASFVKIIYFVPMAFAFLAVAGAIIYQLATMYVPAAAAIEGQAAHGAIRAAWTTVRRQWGRVVLHWLIVTVAVGVVAYVSLFLALEAISLPMRIFGTPEDYRVAQAWTNFSGLFVVYQGLAFGVGLTLPISLLSTLGTISYITLRHPAGEALFPAPPDETSGTGIEGVRGGTSHPGEQTQPGETRPAPPDESSHEVSDDSDEQPLVKD